MKIKIPLASDEFIANLVLQRTGPFLAMGGNEVFKEWNVKGSKAELSAL